MGDPESSPPTTSSGDAPQERRYYNTRTWFSALLGTATNEEIMGYLNERDDIEESNDFERCEQQKQWLFQNSTFVPPPSTSAL